MCLLARFACFAVSWFSQTTRCWFGQCPDWAVYLKCSLYIGCDAPPEQEAKPEHLHNLNTITAYKSKHTFIPRVERRPGRLKKWREGIWIPRHLYTRVTHSFLWVQWVVQGKKQFIDFRFDRRGGEVEGAQSCPSSLFPAVWKGILVWSGSR